MIEFVGLFSSEVLATNFSLDKILLWSFTVLLLKHIEFFCLLQIDELLDIAQLQVMSGNVKERAAAVRSLNATLGKQDWLTGGQPCVADVVMWSALHQAGQTASAPANVKKWLKLCSQNALFQSALAFVS